MTPKEFKYWIIEDKKMLLSEELFMCDVEQGFIQYADQGYYTNNANCSDKHREYLLNNGIEPKDDFIALQYIGIKDRNGKKIFEGDIVLVDRIFCEVKWFEDEFRFYFYSEKFNEKHVPTSSCEIVGNIFENKDSI